MSQWGSHLSYVPPPPESSVPDPPIMNPLQPHLTGLTEFGHGVGDNTFVQNTPVAPAPPETNNPLILLNTLINKFRSWRDEINGRMTQIENHMQANSFNMAHFNGLHTDLQTIFDQIQAIPSTQRPQLTGTNRQPPPPPVASIPLAHSIRVAQPTAPTVRVELAKPDKFDGKKDKSTTFKVAITQYLRATYPGISDNGKIAFIILYLDGKASEWIEPHMEHDVLRQAKSSVQDYVTEFQSLAAYVNYDNLALRDMFYEGLKGEIKMAMLSQLFDVKDNTTTGQMVVDRALLIDQHLEQFAGRSIFENKNSSSNNCTATAFPAREKLSSGDAVYMISTDGRAVEGKIESIGQNSRGQMVPNFKWTGQNTMVQVPFPALKKDDRPTLGTSRAPPPPPVLAKGKGPGPMELDESALANFSATADSIMLINGLIDSHASGVSSHRRSARSPDSSPSSRPKIELI
ncbi:Transposon Tf2-7 polyprotein [Ceratobasidium sp. AG-Ba]|nr:Transposon Tf2-7 polyprotein [Ceratobasidium sp. AG-Ba]